MYRFQEVISHYLSELDVSDCSGVTLTMKQGVDGERLDSIRSSRNLRHFMNLLNRSVYGTRFKRFGVRLSVVPSLELSKDGRIHYHLVMKNPKHMDRTTFFQRIHELWGRTKFGYHQIHIHSNIDVGWTGYITKFRSIRDEIDWENFYWK